MKKQYKEQILELLLKLEYIFLLFYICHVFFFQLLCGTPDAIYRSVRHWLAHKLILTLGLHLAHKPKFPLHFMMYLLFAESTFSGSEGKRECGHQ